jgi:5-methylcytosine-specific restriction endonuclease McrA
VCPLCKEVMVLLRGVIEIDHKDPNRQEGFNDDDNLQLTHRRCNRRKSSGSLYQQAKKMNRTIMELL